jgi:uncharacterized membrane protein YkoI
VLLKKTASVFTMIICAITLSAAKADQPAADNHSQFPASNQMLSTRAKISMQEAEALALARVPGRTEEIELGTEGEEKIVFEVDITQDEKSAEVKIDAVTGTVMSVEFRSNKPHKGSEKKKSS